MPLLVRKITQSKWKDTANVPDVKADAITSDLRTSNNTLSFWEINDTSELNEAVLAIVTAPNINFPEKIDIIYADKENFIKDGLEINYEKGNTAINDLADTHINVCNVTYSSLGTVSQIILESMNNLKFKRFGRTEIKNMLKEANSEGRINREKCNKDYLDKLELL